jgi:AcrR family transcriptional regulator
MTTEAPVAPTRERLLAAATGLCAEQGWSALTVVALADRAGVSRQTVYNTFGSRTGLARALVDRELERLLAVVDAGLPGGGDLAGDVTRTVAAVLALGRGTPLLAAAVSASHGARTDLLPLLTVDAPPLVATARALVVEILAVRYRSTLPPSGLVALADTVVRTVLSHLLQAPEDDASAAAGLGWLVARITDEPR